MSDAPTSPIYIRNSEVVAIESEISARYSVGAIIGTGAYGTVFSAVDRETNLPVAVKIMSKKRLGSEGLTKVEREVQIMGALNHPCILRMLNFVPSPNFFNIVMERIEGGELFGHLIRLSKYTERKACRVTRNLLRALKHMHDRGYMHCDLKPENLLLEKAPANDEEVTSIKLADFGLAQVLHPDNMPRKCCGSPLYMAPEVLHVGFQKTRQFYDQKADLWSTGVITYLLLSGLIPFYGRTPNEIFKAVLATQHNFSNAIWASVSDDAKDFINKLFVKEPELRMSASEALDHPWIKLSEGEDSEGDLELQGSLERISQFNAEQKLKGAVFGVEATFRLAYLSGCQTRKLKANSRVVELLTSTVSTVTVIDLSNNYLGPNGLQALTEALSSASHVTTLNLTNVLLYDEQLEALVEFFLRPQCLLHTLYVDINNLTHRGGRVLLDLVRRQPRLTEVTATRNHIKESILLHIREACTSNCTNVKEKEKETSVIATDENDRFVPPQILKDKVTVMHTPAPPPLRATKVYPIPFALIKGVNTSGESSDSTSSISGISSSPPSLAKGCETKRLLSE